MTSRQIFESALIELSKTHAPALLLEDFNYFFRKAVNQYINKRYNIYDVNQQTTDDLRVLKSSAVLTPKIADENNNDLYKVDSIPLNLYKATYEVELPTDYLHTLNCICTYRVKTKFSCWNAGDIVYFKANRLSADLWGSIINNYYERPIYKRPYYYIHNINSSEILPTNPYTGNSLGDPTSGKENTGTDGGGTFDLSRNIYTNPNGVTYYSVYKRPVSDTTTVTCLGTNLTAQQVINLSISDLYTTTDNINTIKVQNWTTGSDTLTQYQVTSDLSEVTSGLSEVIQQGTVRYGNTSTVRMEIRYGQDNSVFELVKVIIDYVKVPQFINLTQQQIDLTLDTSQIMEFPDYVCQEIINELVTVIMENGSDPRLQTHIPISQSIANPTQQSEQVTHKK